MPNGTTQHIQAPSLRRRAIPRMFRCLLSETFAVGIPDQAEVCGTPLLGRGVGIAVEAAVGAGPVASDVPRRAAAAGGTLSGVFPVGRFGRGAEECAGCGSQVFHQRTVAGEEADEQAVVDAAVVGDAVAGEVGRLPAGGQVEPPPTVQLAHSCGKFPRFGGRELPPAAYGGGTYGPMRERRQTQPAPRGARG